MVVGCNACGCGDSLKNESDTQVLAFQATPMEGGADTTHKDGLQEEDNTMQLIDAAEVTQGLPDPVCRVRAEECAAVMPALIMPGVEAQLLVDLAELKNVQNATADVTSSAGALVLSCNFTKKKSRTRRVEISCNRPFQDPLTIVSMTQITPESNLDVAGRGERFYGHVFQAGSGQAKLQVGDIDALTFQVADVQEQELVALSSGEKVGCTQKVPGGTMWKMTVAPGADWVVIITTFISMVVLDFPPGCGLNEAAFGAI